MGAEDEEHGATPTARSRRVRRTACGREQTERDIDRSRTERTPREPGRRGAQHETLDPVGMPLREELGHRRAHRVSGDEHPPGSQNVEQRGEIVGAVGEPECLTRTDAAPVAAQIGSEHAKLDPEHLERAEPVESSSRPQAVDEQHGRRTRWSGDFPDEGPTPPGEFDPPPQRHRRTQLPVRPRQRLGNAVTDEQPDYVDRINPHRACPPYTSVACSRIRSG